MPERPELLVVVDTEEEFDWSGGFSREATNTVSLAAIERGQTIFDEYLVRPVYVVDYPVARNPQGLSEIHRSGRAVIGAHLHPWVNPPFGEEVNGYNSFAGNLPRELEYAKLSSLTSAIEDSFSERPVIYKAGRYGIGPNSMNVLAALNYQIDLSPNPPFDMTAEGGPDFSQWPVTPHWSANDRILCIPGTGAFLGFVKTWGRYIDKAANQSIWRALRASGVLSKIGALDRLKLSPEGYSFEEMRRLTQELWGQGVGAFVLSFHSPSLAAGCTPYVKNRSDLDKFVATIRRYLEYFMSDLGGASITPGELRDRMLVARGSGKRKT